MFGGGQLFDWVKVGDYNLLAQAFENKLLNFFEKQDLDYGVAPTTPHYSVYNKTNTVYWFHLFSRDCYDNLNENVIELEYQSKKQKIDYLVEKFKKLKKYRTLYILAELDPRFFLSSIDCKNMLIRIRNGLEKLRGNRNFSLLFCSRFSSFEIEIGNFENIYIKTLSYDLTENLSIYMGIRDSSRWDPILFEFPFTIEKIKRDHTGIDSTMDDANGFWDNN